MGEDVNTGTARDEAPIRTVPDGTRVYAIGDIHGCADRLRALHERILQDCRNADAKGPAATRRVIVYLGDYIDRGPDSRGVIELLTSTPLAGFERIHLKGNHETFMTDILDGAGELSLWLVNGGAATLRSYGIDQLAVAAGIAGVRDALLHQVPAAHLEFLQALRFSHVEGDYVFVHAGLRPGVAIEAQDPYDLMWIRAPFLHSDADHGKIVVHGHTPSAEPVLRANRIGIDTGACMGGNLTALVLDGAERRFLQV